MVNRQNFTAKGVVMETKRVALRPVLALFVWMKVDDATSEPVFDEVCELRLFLLGDTHEILEQLTPSDTSRQSADAAAAAVCVLEIMNQHPEFVTHLEKLMAEAPTSPEGWDRFVDHWAEILPFGYELELKTSPYKR
jgi:hypothetical protein